MKIRMKNTQRIHCTTWEKFLEIIVKKPYRGKSSSPQLQNKYMVGEEGVHWKTSSLRSVAGEVTPAGRGVVTGLSNAGSSCANKCKRGTNSLRLGALSVARVAKPWGS